MLKVEHFKEKRKCRHMVNKVGCAIPMVISSDLCMKQHIDDGHKEGATNFTSFTSFFGAFHDIPVIKFRLKGQGVIYLS